MSFLDQSPKILITGGGGYVGSALVPFLLNKGCHVTAYDLFLYGEDVLDDHPNLTKIKGDIRNRKSLVQASENSNAIIHLACISNDPSFELNPQLGKSINLDAFHNVLDAVRYAKPQRFIYASSSSIYGIQDTPDVREDTPPQPLTDYSKFKLQCEHILQKSDLPEDVTWSIIRPATVCGYSKRLRLDLVVNILTINALVNNCIKVFGGSQLRPNIVIDDMVRAYAALLDAPSNKVHKEAFNAGYHNFGLDEIANLVKSTLGNDDIQILKQPTNDLRSYHINSDKIHDAIGFKPTSGLDSAIQGLKDAFHNNLIIDGLDNPLYHNIKLMQQVNLA